MRPHRQFQYGCFAFLFWTDSFYSSTVQLHTTVRNPLGGRMSSHVACASRSVSLCCAFLPIVRLSSFQMWMWLQACSQGLAEETVHRACRDGFSA